MGNKIEVFNNNEFGEIRAVEINGEPWLVGKDVCSHFGDKNHNRTLSRLDEDDKRMVELTDSMGRTQKATVINESGLYSVLFAMQPQKANRRGVSDAYPIEVQERIEHIRKFKHWVTSEVLPSIRKHGMYAVDELLNNPDLAIKIFTDLKEEREKNRQLKEQNALLVTQNAELKPKASYYDIVLQCKDLIPITVIAKDYGWSARKMNEFLSEQKVQFKSGDIWLLYQKYAEMGYTSTKTNTYTNKDGETHSKIHTYWTQKGRLFIYELMKKNGTLPLIEQEH